jgi:hypothetical protein
MLTSKRCIAVSGGFGGMGTCMCMVWLQRSNTDTLLRRDARKSYQTVTARSVAPGVVYGAGLVSHIVLPPPLLAHTSHPPPPPGHACDPTPLINPPPCVAVE